VITMETEERIFEKTIFNCKDCEHHKTDKFTIPDKTVEKNRFMQASDYFKTYFYAYCMKECKFIIPVTTYLDRYTNEIIKFPDFCPLAKSEEEKNLREVCEWFKKTYPEEDNSTDGSLSDIIDIRNKMIDVLEYLERG